MAWTPKTAEPVEGWKPKTAEPVEPEPYENLPPQSAEADDALAQARAKLPKAKPEPATGYEPGFLEGSLRSFVEGGTHSSYGEGAGLAAEKFGGKGIKGLKAQLGKALKMPDGSVRSLATDDDVYRAVRDWNDQADDKHREKHPVTAFLISALGGMTADAAAAGPKLLKKGYQIGTGALSGLMGSRADLTDDKRDTGEILKAGAGTAFGGTVAAAAPAVLPYLGKKLTGAGNALKDFAEERAVKVLGRDLDGLLEGGKHRVNELGRDLLDSGVVSWGRKNLLGTTTEDAAERIDDLAITRRQKLDGIIDMLDDVAKPEDKLKVSGLVDRARKTLAAGKAPAERGLRDTISGEIDEVAKLAAPIGTSSASGAVRPLLPETAELTLRQTEELLKRPYAKRVNWEKTPSASATNQEALRRLSSFLKREGEAQAQNIVEKRAPDMAGEFISAKNQYGNAAEAAKIAGKQIKRDLKNNLVKPTDYAAGMAGAAAAAGEATSGPTAAAWALANHVLKGRGNSIAAVSADKIADLAKKLQTREMILQKYGPAVGQYMSRELLRDYPEVFEFIDPPQAGSR